MNTTELKKLAEAATGDLWVVGSGPYDQSRHIYCNSPVTDGDESWLPLIASTDDAETLIDHEANAAYIAAANPAAILKLLAINAELVDALNWYAEQARLCRLIHSEGDSGRKALDADGGQRARAALAKAEGGEL